MKLENVRSMDEAKWYLGKHVAFVYSAKNLKIVSKRDKDEIGKSGAPTTKERIIWGKIVKTHGNSGVVKARFSPPLPPTTFGCSVRVMLYPLRN